jgi:threonine dehydrogenase-like Zn-dependent dehydrogenase
MLAAGVCGTDVQIAARTRTDVAAVLGHEGVGVLRVSGERERLVVFNPVDIRDPDAILGHSFDGVFRSWVPLGPELPLGALREVVALDPVALLALCEPLATVLYTWELIGPTPGTVAVGIWGAGPIGALQASEAVAAGHDVAVVHPSQSRLDWLRDRPFGESVRCMRDACRSGPLDIAVMCVPKPAMAVAVHDAAAALVPGGLMVLVPALEEDAAGATFADPAVGRVRRRNQCGWVDAELGTVRARTREGKPLRLTGHRGTSLEQLGAAERRLRSDPERFASLITHRVRADQAAALINARCAGRSRDDHGAEIVKLIIEFALDEG